ncbi:hypothetical protein ZWY2020_029973 [Hordeum vulgare]|nr:hypothetical protein ZWY2020_029973 [Hordeum vulgare]
MLVRVLLGKYDLLPHVNTVTAEADRTPDWTREDYVVRSWLYGSISDEILDIIMAEDPGGSGRDLSVTAYCHRLKALSDALGDVGTPISDQTLVLNCLRGLNARFSDITTIVTMQSPLPSFAQTRSLLTLRETQLANSTVVGHQTALSGDSSHGAGGYHGAGASYGAGGSNTSGQNRGDGNRSGVNFGGNRNGGGNWRKKKNSGGSNTSSNSGNQRSNQASSPVGPWVCFNPYTGQQLQRLNGKAECGPPPRLATQRPTGASFHLAGSSSRTGVRHQPAADPRLWRHSVLGLHRANGRPQQRRHPLDCW